MSFNPYPANVENMVSPNNASKWQMGFNWAFKGLKCPLTLILLTWRIWWAPSNASKWQMGFNSAFKVLKCRLTLILLTWRIWWAPNNTSRWQMGFNSAFKVLNGFNGCLFVSLSTNTEGMHFFVWPQIDADSAKYAKQRCRIGLRCLESVYLVKLV